VRRLGAAAALQPDTDVHAGAEAADRYADSAPEAAHLHADA
jgi:hypothetical protein